MRPNHRGPFEADHAHLAGKMMSPSVALHDRVFLTWLAIVPVTFTAAGVILVVVQFGFKKDLGGIWDTYRSWWIMGVVGLATVFLGRIAVVAGVALLALLAFHELVRASPLKKDRLTADVVGAGIVAFVLSGLLPAANARVVRQDFLYWIGLVVVAAIFLVPILTGRWEGAVSRAGLALIGFVFLGVMLGQIGNLTNLSHAYGLVCYVIFATELNDVAAFAFGRTFGRHPLCPAISPNKTWEGAIGAVAVSMALPWLFRFSLPTFGSAQLLCAGLIVGVGGQVGDLSVSLIKRELGTKDMGSVIAGHGGILDRIDSLIYVAPLFMQLAAHCDLSP
jgi:phosphatidate cytidylyltransferase